MIAAILNGDDFGLAPAINEGILKAHREGCLTSASLSVVGPAAEAAAMAAADEPELGVGLHLTLVDEWPVSDPEAIPSLLMENGRFYPDGSTFARCWLGQKVRRSEVRREIRAQLALAQQLGVHLTHLDSHDHVHVLPGLFEIILEEMESVGLKRLRIPLEAAGIGAITWRRRLSGLGLYLLAWRARRIARRKGFVFPDAYQGFRGAGQVDRESLLERIESMAAGVTELSLHPAAGPGPPRQDFAHWGYCWDAELAALLDKSVRAGFDRREIRLVNFNDLPLMVSKAAPRRTNRGD
jgi:hopanoid biosynthesis associated protein HpnK